MPPLTCIELEFPEGAYFEGGDAVAMDQGRVIFIGYGNGRTTRQGAEIIKEEIHSLTKAAVFLLPMQSSKWYHLDTCFFPMNHCLLLAEPLDRLFEPSAVKLLENLWPQRYVLSERLLEMPDAWHHFACNNVQIGKKLITSVPYPRKLQAYLKRWYPDMQLISPPVSELLFGGGGVACATLMDAQQSLVVTVHPTECNLHQYRLNTMQNDQHHEGSHYDLADHQAGLVDTMHRLREQYASLYPVILQSHTEVPECIYVKDMGLLLKVEDEYHLLMGQLRCMERSNEKRWFLQAIRQPVQVTPAVTAQENAFTDLNQ